MISRNLAQRIAVAAVAIPAIIFLVFRGGDLFLYFVLLLAAIGICEYLAGGKVKVVSVPFIFSFIGAVVAAYFIAGSRFEAGGLILLSGFMLNSLWLAAGREAAEVLFSKLKYITWGMVYTGVLFPFLYLIRGEAAWMEPAPGRWWLFLLLGSIWLCDTVAQLFGWWLGRHKLAPEVSPHKTVEGFAGGFLGAFVAAGIFKIFWLKEIGVIHLLALSMLIGLFGQLGDLVESMWKRSIGAKDSSRIIPGHGGVLDRFDSLLFASPAVYLYLKFILQAPWL